MKKISILGHLVIVWALLALLLVGVNVAWGSETFYIQDECCLDGTDEFPVIICGGQALSFQHPTSAHDLEYYKAKYKRCPPKEKADEPEDICQTCRELCPDEPKECRWEYKRIADDHPMADFHRLNEYLKNGWKFVDPKWYYEKDFVWLRRQVCDD